jgi:hypothetical protein
MPRGMFEDPESFGNKNKKKDLILKVVSESYIP